MLHILGDLLPGAGIMPRIPVLSTSTRRTDTASSVISAKPQKAVANSPDDRL